MLSLLELLATDIIPWMRRGNLSDMPGTDRSATKIIRAARSDEFGLLRAIEEESDKLYSQLGFGPFADDDSGGHLARAAIVLVAGEPVIGFASVEIVDGNAHLWQLSVLPSASGRGTGTALVEAVCEWSKSHGYSAVTLTTYRDVAWNAPFFSRLGFEALDKLTPGLAAIRDHEMA